MRVAAKQLDLFAPDSSRIDAQKELTELAKSRNFLQSKVDSAKSEGLKKLYQQALLSNMKRANDLFPVAFPQPSPTEVKKIMAREANRKQPWYKNIHHK